MKLFHHYMAGILYAVGNVFAGCVNQGEPCFSTQEICHKTLTTREA